MATYKVFLRAATNFKEFSTARKQVIRRGMTLEDARDYCHEWNRTRSPNAVKSGTKAEFTSEGDE